MCIGDVDNLIFNSTLQQQQQQKNNHLLEMKHVKMYINIYIHKICLSDYSECLKYLAHTMQKFLGTDLQSFFVHNNSPSRKVFTFTLVTHVMFVCF